MYSQRPVAVLLDLYCLDKKTLIQFNAMQYVLKVKSVLEAVNILLSDGSSPFVCLIAVDSRIVVKCIDQSYGSTLPKANVSGHEYLKKLINLPFCLPEVKKQFTNMVLCVTMMMQK